MAFEHFIGVGAGAAALAVSYALRRWRRSAIDDRISQVITRAAQDQWIKEATRKDLKFDRGQRITATMHRAQRLLAEAKMQQPADLKLRIAAALQATQGVVRA